MLEWELASWQFLSYSITWWKFPLVSPRFWIYYSRTRTRILKVGKFLLFPLSLSNLWLQKLPIILFVSELDGIQIWRIEGNGGENRRMRWLSCKMLHGWFFLRETWMIFETLHKLTYENMALFACIMRSICKQQNNKIWKNKIDA
jgi:hypothetical protein